MGSHTRRFALLTLSEPDGGALDKLLQGDEALSFIRETLDTVTDSDEVD